VLAVVLLAAVAFVVMRSRKKQVPYRHDPR
jgi:hypothetical protein